MLLKILDLRSALKILIEERLIFSQHARHDAPGIRTQV